VPADSAVLAGVGVDWVPHALVTKTIASIRLARVHRRPAMGGFLCLIGTPPREFVVRCLVVLHAVGISSFSLHAHKSDR
jgi:hypothetical protein